MGNMILLQKKWIFYSIIAFKILEYPCLAQEFCFWQKLSDRTGSEHCWVFFRTQPHHRVCIPHSVWKQHLNSPLSQCVLLKKSWKKRASLENGNSAKKVFLVNTLQPYSHLQRRNDPFNFFKRCILLIERAREKTSQLLQPGDPDGILRKLILNEGSPQQPIYLLRRLGFVHLLSPSGIHLDIIGHMGYFGTQAILKTCLKLPLPAQTLLFPLIRWMSASIALSLCLLIGALNGARVGLLRPWILLCLRIMAKTSGLRWKKAAPLILALLIDWSLEGLFTDSEELFWIHMGRWIYALAVGGGLLWSQTLPLQHLSLAIGSWILVALWEVLESGTLSLATPVISWLTLPILCGWLYPLILFNLLFQAIVHLLKPLSEPCWAQYIGISAFESWAFCEAWAQKLLCLTSEGFSQLVLQIVKWALLPGNVWIIPPEVLLCGASMALIFVMLRPRLQYEGRWGLFLILICFLLRGILTSASFSKGPNDPKIPHQALEAKRVEQLDVGQGDAALVDTLLPSRTIGLIDTGSEKSLSEDQWIGLLAKRRIHLLNWIHLTHLDADHVGGLFRLAKLIPIGCVFSSQAELETKRGLSLIQRLHAMNVEITHRAKNCVPYPTFQVLSEKNRQSARNQNMNAIWVPLQGQGFYLSGGDASAQDEIPIGRWAKQLSQERTYLRILKISHHGSHTSTSMDYLHTLKPTEAWISSGVGNLYGHPRSLILERLKALNIPIHRTDQAGHLLSKSRAQMQDRYANHRQ